MSAVDGGANTRNSPVSEYGDRESDLTLHSPNLGDTEQPLTTTNEFNGLLDYDWSSSIRNIPQKPFAQKLSDLELIMANPAVDASFGYPSPALNVTLQDGTELVNGTAPIRDDLTSSGIRNHESNPKPSRSDERSQLGFEKSIDFENVLDHCSQLHKDIIETMKHASRPLSGRGSTKGDQPNRQVNMILDRIDAACSLLFGLYCKNKSPKTTTVPDHATMSLALASMSKIFQACSLVLDQNSLREHDVDSILGRKRLDFNITQAKMVASKIKEMSRDGTLIFQRLASDALETEDSFQSGI